MPLSSLARPQVPVQATPSVLGKQPAEAPPAQQPIAKKPKRDKEDIDDENDILKVLASALWRPIA